jgi:hypothetical protein
MARAGPDIRRERQGNVDNHPLRISFQPRLVAGATCLVETLENLCDFIAP